MRSSAVFRLGLAFTVLVFFFPLISPAYSAVIYVKPPPSGDDAKNGLNWANAKATVNGAISVAARNDEIWVAAGTYQEHIHNKVIDFGAVEVALYGGFAGTETSRTQRNYNINLTILDGANTGIVVQIGDNAGSTTRVDGFLYHQGNGGC